MSQRLSKKQFNRRVEKAVARADVYAILKHLHLPFRKRGINLWYRCRVYTHKNPTMTSTKIVSHPYSQYHGIWKCWSCGESGNIIQLVEMSKDIPFMEALALVESFQLDIDPDVVKPFYKSDVKLPIYYQSPEKKNDWDSRFLDYLMGRGILWEQIIGHRIGYVDAGKYDNRIIVPVMLGVKELRTFIARSILPDIDPDKRVTSAQGGKPGLFGSEFAHPTKGPAIICEGWADALHIERIGYANAMSIQTAEVHPVQFEFINKFEYAIVVPDGDDGGRSLVDKLAPWIEDFEFIVATLPEGKDPDDVSSKELEDAIGNATEWEPSPEKFEIEVSD